jgi:hypothetical protein
MVFLKLRSQLRIRGEICSLVCALAQCRERNTTPQSCCALFLHHRIQGVGSVSVLWYVEGVGHGVVLRLQSDLDDFHWCNNDDGFCDTSSETSCRLSVTVLERVMAFTASHRAQKDSQ